MKWQIKQDIERFEENEIAEFPFQTHSLTPIEAETGFPEFVKVVMKHFILPNPDIIFREKQIFNEYINKFACDADYNSKDGEELLITCPVSKQRMYSHFVYLYINNYLVQFQNDEKENNFHNTISQNYYPKFMEIFNSREEQILKDEWIYWGQKGKEELGEKRTEKMKTKHVFFNKVSGKFGLIHNRMTFEPFEKP